MLKCSKCGLKMNEGFIPPAPCPECGHKIPRPDNALGKATVGDDVVAKGNLSATIESGSHDPPAAPPKPKTVQGNIAATIDTGALLEPSTPATANPSLDRTIDSDSGLFVEPEKGAGDTGFSISPSSAADPKLTNPDRREMQTIDSADSQDLSPDEKRVTGIWSKTFLPQAKPWQTLKGKESFRPKDSKLVIKSRALKTVTHERPTGADYELLGIIGEGGMGVVYSARQASIDRNVAIKMLKPEAARDHERREKFLSEAVVTGELDHPNIVPIYDLGANEQNALFYAMKRVQGTPWSAVIESKPQSENVEILLKVADAVAFAHSRGIVHRDLKPENVMLGDFGEVLVMDWGLALSTPQFRKAESITQSTSMGGTPAYMAPEMAMGPVERVSATADVYLLGAILYEIIAHQPPHAGESVMSCLQAAAKNVIQSTNASGELLEIALRAMATDPADRYETVPAFQSAIRLYQDHSESIALAVRAEKDLTGALESDNYQQFSRAMFAFEESLSLWSGNEHADRGVRDSRLAYARSAERKGDYDLALSLLVGDDEEQTELRTRVLAAAKERDARHGRLRNAKRLLVGLAAVVVVVISAAYIHAVRARQVAERARSEAVVARFEEEKQKLAADEARAIAEQKSRDEAAARQDAEVARGKALEAKQAEEYEAYVARIGLAAAKIEENSFGYAEQLLAECPQEYRNWEWGRLKFLCQQSVRDVHCGAPVDAVAFSPNAKQFVTGSWDGLVQIWETETGKQVREIPYGSQYVHGVAWSADGKWIAAAGSDKGAGIKVWDANTGELRQTIAGHKDTVLSVAFSRDGRKLLSTSYDHTARLWSVEDGRELRVFDGHSWWVWSAAFSPDETQIATASQDGTVRIWSLAESSDALAEAPAVFTGHRGPVYAVSFSRDGRQLASGGYDGRVLVWKPADVQPFDFKQILSAAGQPTPPFVALDGHGAAVRSVQFSQDDRMIVSGGHDNAIRIWDPVDAVEIKTLRGHAGWIRCAVFSPDAQLVLSASHDYDAKLWQIAAYEEMRIIRGRVLEGHDDAVLCAVFSRDGSKIATASRDRTAKTWDFSTGAELQVFKEGHEFLASNAAFSNDGRRLVTAAIDNTTRIWDVATGTEAFVLNGTGRSAALALSSDGKWVLTSSETRNAKLWNAKTGELAHTLDTIRSEVTAVAFSPDASKFCTADVAGRLRLWNTESWQELWSNANHNGRIAAVAFTPDGKRILTACIDKTVGQFSVADGKEEVSGVLKHPDAVLSIAIDNTGRLAVTSCADNIARVWSLADSTLVRELTADGARLTSVAISPDSRRVITVGDLPAGRPGQVRQNLLDRKPMVRVWDLASGESLGDVKLRGSQVWSALFSPDGGAVLTVGGTDARLWDLATGLQRMSFTPHGAVASVAFSPDGLDLVTASWDNSARIWDVTSGKTKFKLQDVHTARVNAVAYAYDGHAVLTASDDTTAAIWDPHDGRLLHRLEGHTEGVRSVAISRDGKLALTGSQDKTAKLWDLQTAKEKQTFVGHAWAVTSAVLSHDSTRVLTGSDDKTAKLWNSETGACLLTLSGHTAAVSAVALSPDGLRAVTASQDNICKLWDTRTGKEILTLKGHAQELTSVCFSDDGRYVLTAGRDGAAIVWLAAPWVESSK